MASVLGLPKLKGNNHKIVTCKLIDGFYPAPGQAVSIQQDDLHIKTVIPFNGDFYGIACEVKYTPARVSVVRSGIQVGVIIAPGAVVNPVLNTYFDDNGLLTDESGYPVNAYIVTNNERVINPYNGQALAEAGALITFDKPQKLDTPPPIPPDFNKPDFLNGDFA